MTQGGKDSGHTWPTVAGSSLESLARMVPSAPQKAAGGAQDAAQRPRSERQRKADATTEAALRLIDDETAARDAKTQRLRAARLNG